MELTKAQIEKQDFVDNAISDLIRELNPSREDIDWNIEIIAEIRDRISSYFEEIGICAEQDFYPFIDE